MKKIELFFCMFFKSRGIGLEVQDQYISALREFVQTIATDTMWNSIDAILHRIVQNRVILARLKALPLVPQKSAEWLALRQNMLTASDLGQSMDKGKFGSRRDLLLKKANLVPDMMKGKGFIAPPLKWGVMFESMALRCYTQRNFDIGVHEFGLIPHPHIHCFGASPDAITDLGVMVEIKCPWRRVMDGTIPEQYYLQIQGQLAVCELSECDYVECNMTTFEDADEYAQRVGPIAVQDHGVIVEISEHPSNETRYEYSPPYLTAHQALEWRNAIIGSFADNDAIGISKIHYWTLSNIWIQRVTFDAAAWEPIVGHIHSFWNEVLRLRAMTKEEADQYVAATAPVRKRAQRIGTKEKEKEKEKIKEKEVYQFLEDD